MKNTKTEKKVTILISVILTILLILGLTYAYFSAKSTTDTRSVVTGNLKITYEDGRMINAEKLIPMPEEYVDEEGTEISFTVKNSGSMSGYFNVGLIDVNIDEGLASEDFKWRLKSEDKVIINGTFKNIITDKVLQSGLEIGANETKNYKLQIWIQETDKDQTSMMNKVFRAKIDITGKNKLTDLAQNEPLVLTNTVEGDTLKNLKIYGNSFQSNLPYPYQEVEYIESTGTQHIDTKVSGNNNNLKFEVQYSWTTVPASGVYRYIFGTYGDENYNATRLLQYGTNITYTNINVKAGSSTTVFNYTRTANTIYTESLDSTEYISNGTVTPEIGLSKGTANNQTVKLFNLGSNNNTSALIKLYYFRIYDNNVLVRDMIPCYNVQTNVIGLYDTVNNVFYTNKGTETFLKGDDVIPTPENPIEVKSFGETSKNLFDKTNIQANTLNAWTVNENSYYSNNNNYFPLRVEAGSFKRGKIVTLSVKSNVTNNKYRIKLFKWITDTVREDLTQDGLIPIEGINSITYTFTEDCERVGVGFYGISATSGEIEFSNIQLEYGTTATEYRPYNYIDVTSSGKNLFDKTNIINDTYIGSTGKLVSASEVNTSDFISVLPNTHYQQSTYTGGTRYGISFWDINKTYISKSYDFGKFILTPANAYYMRSSVLNNDLDVYQITEGLMKVDYGPYQKPITTTIDLTGHEPLRKIGDVADYIDYNSGKIVRKIGKIILNGGSNEYWQYFSPQGVLWYVNPLINNNYQNIRIMCDKLNNYTYNQAVSDYTNQGCFPTSDYRSGGFAIRYPEITDVASGLSFLSNNPLTIYYVLQTPKEEDIDLPDIKTLNGTTIISSNGNIKPFFEGKY